MVWRTFFISKSALIRALLLILLPLFMNGTGYSFSTELTGLISKADDAMRTPITGTDSKLKDSVITNAMDEIQKYIQNHTSEISKLSQSEQTVLGDIQDRMTKYIFLRKTFNSCLGDLKDRTTLDDQVLTSLLNETTTQATSCAINMVKLGSTEQLVKLYGQLSQAVGTAGKTKNESDYVEKKDFVKLVYKQAMENALKSYVDIQYRYTSKELLGLTSEPYGTTTFRNFYNDLCPSFIKSCQNEKFRDGVIEVAQKYYRDELLGKDTKNPKVTPETYDQVIPAINSKVSALNKKIKQLGNAFSYVSTPFDGLGMTKKSSDHKYDDQRKKAVTEYEKEFYSQASSEAGLLLLTDKMQTTLGSSLSVTHDQKGEYGKLLLLKQNEAAEKVVQESIEEYKTGFKSYTENLSRKYDIVDQTNLPSLFKSDPNREVSQLDEPIASLIQYSPVAVGQILLTNPEYIGAACSYIKEAQIKKEKDELFQKRFQLVSTIVGAGLTITGVGSPLGAAVFAGEGAEATLTYIGIASSVTAFGLSSSTAYISGIAEAKAKIAKQNTTAAMASGNMNTDSGNLKDLVQYIRDEQTNRVYKYVNGVLTLLDATTLTHMTLNAKSFLKQHPELKSRFEDNTKVLSPERKNIIESFYSPGSDLKSISPAEILKADASDLAELKKMGVGVQLTDKLSDVEDDVRRGVTQLKLDGTTDFKMPKQIYEVTSLPPPEAGPSFKTNALMHPEMAAYKERLEKMGYKLVIDTSLRNTSTGAYFWSRTGVVALRTDSNWATFLHEFQHAEYNSFIKGSFSKLKESVEKGAGIGELLQSSGYSAAHIQKIEKLIAKGLPNLAVNETLSVDAELQAMGLRRYLPAIGGGNYRRYALRHQITELLEVQKSQHLTSTQSTTLLKAQSEYHILLAYDYGVPMMGTGGAVVGGAILAITENDNGDVGALKKKIQDMIQHPEKDPYSYKQMLEKKNGDVLAQKEDGSWVELKK